MSCWSLFVCNLFLAFIVHADLAEIYEHSEPKEDSSQRYYLSTYSPSSYTHAESPVWDHENETLYWVDVIEKKIYSINYINNKLRSKSIAYGEVNVVQPIANSSRLLVSVRSALYLLDWELPGDQGLRLLRTLDEGLPDNVINEGKPDAKGRIWAGTKGPQVLNAVADDYATLYSLEAPNFIPEMTVTPVTISNGMAWSLNNTLFYYIDSATRKVEAFDYDLQNGRVSKRRTIYDLSEHDFPTDAIPDGMTIDSDGFLWVAIMFGGMVIRIDPNNKWEVERHTFPCNQVTSVTWAGQHLNQLIVTTSKKLLTRRQLAEEPLCGKIFVVQSKHTRGTASYKVHFPFADFY